MVAANPDDVVQVYSIPQDAAGDAAFIAGYGFYSVDTPAPAASTVALTNEFSRCT
jgi:hypothetical protein